MSNSAPTGVEPMPVAWFEWLRNERRNRNVIRALPLLACRDACAAGCARGVCLLPEHARRPHMSQARVHLVLFDGVCGLCTRLNRFILARDRHDRFRFASLQSAIGRSWVERFGGDPDALTTLVVIEAFESDAPRPHVRSDAAAFILRELGGVVRPLAIFSVLPRAWRDAAYDAVARRRYAVFGEHDACPVPTAKSQWKFIGSDAEQAAGAQVPRPR